MTDPNAIAVYLASTYDPTLLGQSWKEKADVDMCQAELKNRRKEVTYLMYT